MEQIEVNKAYIDNLKDNKEFNKQHLAANQSLVQSQNRIADALEGILSLMQTQTYIPGSENELK